MKFGRLQNGLLRAQPETAPSNFISNPTPLKDTTGWSLYSDAAGTAPTDGTGGSVNTGTEINFTRTTSSPLSETASFLFSKIATSSMQGKGVSYDFTINRADQAKVCRIDFDYEVASGTYADGDLTVWLYDVTNAQLIQPSASSILNAIGPQKKQPLSFQTNSNSTSYRLIIHVASTSTSAYTVKFDSVSVTRESISQGTVVTDWVSYTPTTAGLGAVSGIVFSWRRVGDSVEILGRLNTGTPTATFATISLPSGLIADTAKISSSGQVVGSVLVNTSITSVGWYLFGTGSSSNLNIGIRATTTTSGFAYANGNAISNSSGDTISFIATVPIQGLSSSQQLSSDADTRVVAARYSTAAGQSMANGASTLIDFGTKTRDTHGAVTTGGSWKFTAPVPGIYSVSALTVLSSGGGWAAAEEAYLDVYKNGSFLTRLDRYYSDSTHTARVTLGNSDEIDLIAGDYIDIRLYQSSGAAITLLADAASNYVNVSRISGPAQIAASEVIECSYTSDTALSLSAATATTKIYEDKITDTHNAYNTSTGFFTAPAPGYYVVSASAVSGVPSLAVNDEFAIIFQKNSVELYRDRVFAHAAGTIRLTVNGSHTVYLNAQETLRIQLVSDKATSTLGAASSNTMHIYRLGGIG